MSVYVNQDRYRDRLRAALKALQWWKPWYSFYGTVENCMYMGIDDYDKGWDAGYKAALEIRWESKFDEWVAGDVFKDPRFNAIDPKQKGNEEYMNPNGEF